MDRSAENTLSAASRSAGHAWCATAVSRGAPWQCTVSSTSGASDLARYSTCTPAPPYTSGGYSLVRSATFMGQPSRFDHLSLADHGDAAGGDHEPAGQVVLLVDAHLSALGPDDV